MALKTSDFDYHLPPELIAQHAEKQRDASRLFVVDRAKSTFSHKHFFNIMDYLKPGDRLILNNTKVLPARLFCRKSTGAEIELLFLTEIDSTAWRVMANPGRRLKTGSCICVLKNPRISFKVIEIFENGDRAVRLNENPDFKTPMQVFDKYGVLPLPPYIKRASGAGDKRTYQTVYAKNPGAIAAPTAGLHFTRAMLNTLKKKGIGITYVTLHVGAGTFAPVKEENPARHVMHREFYELSTQAAEEIQATSEAGGRNIAVGTTVVRLLEHCARNGWPLEHGQGSTNMMILPPYTFNVVDCLITNFHLPKSTLLMLVCAFGGTERILAAYKEAVHAHYRFFSYGDAMFII